MSKKIVAGILLILFCFLSMAQLKVTFAQDNNQTLSVSDAVYADLALQGELDNVSLYYRDGNSKNDISFREDKEWLPASTVKTYVAMYAFDQISNGNASLGDVVTIKAVNSVPTEDVPNGLPQLNEGDQASVERLIEQMITQSDNTAYNTLLDVFDRREVVKYIRLLGLSNSSIGSKLNQDAVQASSELQVPGYGINTTTASDYGKAFELIKENKISGSVELFNILKLQQINNMLPRYLPKSVVVAHKTGDLDPLYHDGGIVEATSGAYVLSIFSNAGTPDLVAHLSQLVYSRNYDLVGRDILSDKINIKNENDLKEPTLAQRPSDKRIIGASTTALKAPSITAADLGITAADLSLNTNTNRLPTVFIPADSLLHPLVNTYFQLRKAISLNQTDKAKVEIEQLNLQLSESQDLKNRDKLQESKNLVASIQPHLNRIVKQSAISNSTVQTSIKSVSETRFSLFKEDLKEAKGNDRLKLIKQIGTDAKTTADIVQPKLSQANTATSLNQRPIIGEVISSNDNSITIKTAGGQQVKIPKSDTTIKVRSKGAEQPVGDLSQIAPGTTVAMIGTTSENGNFKPSFILSNISRQLSAPQPVTVIKVNSQNNSMIVSENGNSIKIQITPQTSIKGADTDISLDSIKTGDIVVVHGDPVEPNKDQKNNLGSPSSITNPSGSPRPSTLPGSPEPGTSLKTTQQNSGTGATIPNTVSSSTKSVASDAPTPVKSPSPPQNATPQVIKSTSIQIIEKNRDVVNNNPNPALSSQPKSSNTSQQQSAPPPTSNNQSSNSNPTPQSNKKDDKKK